MKNNLLKKTYINFIIKIIVWTFSLFFLTILLYEVIGRLEFQWIYDSSPNLYYNLKRVYDFITNGEFVFVMLIIIWVIGTLIFLYQLLRKSFSYVSAISNAAEKILDKDIEFIELPKELEQFQKQINHLKRQSEKNERLALEQEQKKNDLVVYLAHDLKTPLTSMIGYLSLLDEIKDMPKSKREKYIQIALEKSYRLEDLINELFDITRFNSEKIILEKEEVNLKLMLEQIIDDFYPILKDCDKEVKLSIDEDIVLDADPDKLARVFGNLIKNAINYSTDNLITINVKKEDNFALIITSNKGKKISEEKLKKIFEKFYRVDTSRTTKTGGSGLGLAIAKEIVELHNGMITATSDEEETKFYVRLPIKFTN